MGRTLHTRILRAEPIPLRIWRKVESVADIMNERFTWTCESLKPSLVTDEERRRFKSDSPNDPPIRVYSFTKVANDEWNALLVVRFWRWVSTLLPDALVKVYDEGDYIPAGHVVFTAGRVELDESRIEDRRAYLAEQGLGGFLKQLDVAVAIAKRHGLYFAEFPGSWVADVDEVVALGLKPSDLKHLSIDEVADRIRFPWQKEQG